MAGLLGLAAYWSEDPKLLERPLPVNSTLANFFSIPANGIWDWKDSDVFADMGTEDGLRILMLNYSAYDSAYIYKMKALLTERFPNAVLTDFWDGTTQQLTDVLAGQHLVFITYPANGAARQVRGYGKVLRPFVQQGGAVVFSGTDQFGLLQQYGLFELDFGYFCSGMRVHEDALDHPVLTGTPAEFTLTNYVYPLDISDAAFVTLADIQGYPAIGYKPIGTGKVVYLGIEYYYDEVVSSQILENAVRWLCPVVVGQGPASALVSQTPNNGTIASTSPRRNEERLYAGSGNAPQQTNAPIFDMKVYPNPYLDKATLDVNLDRSVPVSIDMTDEMGGHVAVLLPYRVLSPGFYRFELPNVSPGIYFVKCQAGNQSTVKKVVKAAAQ